MLALPALSEWLMGGEVVDLLADGAPIARFYPWWSFWTGPGSYAPSTRRWNLGSIRGAVTE